MFKKFMIVLLLAFSSLSFAADKININTANASTMAEVLKGIGEAKASAIVSYRKANGPFKNLNDLALVKGIGEKTVEANRSVMTTGK